MRSFLLMIVIPAVVPYPYSQNPLRSLVQTLNVLSRNDRLQCVPRLFCELMSGQVQSRALPFSIDLQPLLGLLTSIDNPAPVFAFTKAAVLGVSSKGDSSICGKAYPQCPDDPDQLVQYLNNYNGGFFRYFSGAVPQKRILNRPSVPKAPTGKVKVVFPEDEYDNEVVRDFRFPEEDFESSCAM